MAQLPSRGKPDHSVILWTVIGMAAVLLVLVIGAYVYLSPERLRRSVVPTLEAALNRKVEIREVGLSLWGGFTAEMEGLRIDDRPGFGERPFLSAEKAGISLDVLAMISGKAGLGELTISRPSISIVVNEDGETNFADIGVDSHTGVESDKGSAGLVVLPLEWVRITDGTFRHLDRRTGSETVANGADLHLHALPAGDGVRLSVHARLDRVSRRSGGGAASEFRDLTLDLDGGWSSPSLSVASASVGLGPAAVKASGTISYYTKATEFDLHIGRQELDLARISDYLASAGVLAESVSLSGGLGLSGRMVGLLKSDDNSLPPHELAIELKDVVYTDAELLVPVRDIGGVVEVKNGSIRVKGFRARAGESDLRLNAAITGLLDPPAAGRPRATFEVTGKLLDLDEIVPPVQAATSPAYLPDSWGFTTPASAADSSAPPEAASPVPWMVRSADAAGRLAFGRFVSDGIAYDRLEADIRAQGGVLSVKDVTADLYGGRLEAEVEIDARKLEDALSLRAKARLDNVNARGLVNEMIGFPVPIEGRMALSIQMTGAMDSALTMVAHTIAADGLATATEARLVNWPLLKRTSRQIAQLNVLDTDEVPLRSVRLPFRVKAGRVYLPGSDLTAAGLVCTLSGSGGLDGSLDFTLDVDLPLSRVEAVRGAGLQGALAAFLGGGAALADVVVPLRVNVRGTTAIPVITGGLRAEAARSTRKSIESKGKGLLKGLF